MEEQKQYMLQIVELEKKQAEAEAAAKIESERLNRMMEDKVKEFEVTSNPTLPPPFHPHPHPTTMNPRR
jgi:hypothetical protein